jgi:hypothetical protein
MVVKNQNYSDGSVGQAATRASSIFISAIKKPPENCGGFD